MEGPYCEACQHYHAQGVKCTICGHIGRCNIFQKMKAKAIANNSFNVWSMGSALTNGCDFNTQREEWAVVRELRGILYKMSNSDNFAEEFDKEECNSRHIICSLGDKPVLAMRYQLHILDAENVTCNLDRFAIMPGYAERDGFREHCVQVLLDDIKKAAQNLAAQTMQSRRIILQLPIKYREVIHTMQQKGSVLLNLVNEAGLTCLALC
jgi:hypothetical protein